MESERQTQADAPTGAAAAAAATDEEEWIEWAKRR